MILTEEEAKTKWCPFARVFNGQSVASGNRDLQDIPFERLRVNCIGSECMAWRNQESPEFKFKAEAEFRRTGMRLVSSEGFCGLAGRQ